MGQRVEPREDLGLELFFELAPPCGEVVALPRILREVEELVDPEAQIGDELVRVTHDHSTRADPGECRPDVGGVAGEEPAKIVAAHRRRRWCTEHGEERGGEIDQLDRRGHARRGEAGGADEEGHADLLLVEREAVIDAAVIAELLAVVRGDHHDELTAQDLLGRGEEPLDFGVHLRDLRVVAVDVGVAEARLAIGLVDVEVVHPRQARRLPRPRHLPEELDGGVRLGGCFEVSGVGGCEVELRLGVVFEALAFRVEDPHREERARAVAGRVESAGEGGLGELRAGDGGLVEVLARHHRGEGVARMRGLGVGALEDDGVLGEAIEEGRRRPVVSVEPEVIGAQGVDGDQQGVGALPGRQILPADGRAPARARAASAGDGIGGGAARRRQEGSDREHRGARVARAGVEEGRANRG